MFKMKRLILWKFRCKPKRVERQVKREMKYKRGSSRGRRRACGCGRIASLFCGSLSTGARAAVARRVTRRSSAATWGVAAATAVAPAPASAATTRA